MTSNKLVSSVLWLGSYSWHPRLIQ